MGAAVLAITYLHMKEKYCKLMKLQFYVVVAV